MCSGSSLSINISADCAGMSFAVHIIRAAKAIETRGSISSSPVTLITIGASTIPIFGYTSTLKWRLSALSAILSVSLATFLYVACENYACYYWECCDHDTDIQGLEHASFEYSIRREVNQIERRDTYNRALEKARQDLLLFRGRTCARYRPVSRIFLLRGNWRCKPKDREKSQRQRPGCLGNW